MKHKLLLIGFVVSLLTTNLTIKAQIISQQANWPNTTWTITGNYGVSGFVKDPRVDANFSFDDDLAGSTSLYDYIIAESPVIDLSAAYSGGEQQVQISFDYVYNRAGDQLYVEWWDGVNWQILEQLDGNSSNIDYKSCAGIQPYISQPLTISTFTASQLVGFKYRIRYDGGNGFYWGFCMGSPTIVSTSTPICIPTTSLAVANITQDGAEFTWTDNNMPSPTNGWEIEYGPAGFTQGTGTTVATAIHPYTLSGLTSSTNYDVYVRAMCSATEQSGWIGPVSFTTLLDVIGCGDQYVDSGGAGGNYSNNENIAQTFCPDVAGEVVTVQFLSFETENCCDYLRIYDGDSAAAPLLGEYRGTNMPPLLTSTHATGCLTFVFHSDGSVERDGWLANILCGPPPTCFLVDTLNVDSVLTDEVTLSWNDLTNSVPPTTYIVEYGPVGFTQGTGTTVTGLNNPATITGLTSSTAYDFYVQADCGGGDTSFWAGPVAVTTLCDVFIAPYVEDFEDAGDLDICWSQGANNLEDWLLSNNVATPGHIGNNDDVSGTVTASGGYFAWVDDSAVHNNGTTLLSPLVDVSGLAIPALSFYFVSHDEGNSHVDFTVDVWDGTAWNVGMFTGGNNTAGWEEIFIDLSGLAITGPIQARFVVNETNGNDFYDDVAIDDVKFDEAPTCFLVDTLNVDSVLTDEVTLSWNDPSNSVPPTTYIIEYGPVGFTHGTGITVTGLNNPATITGLIASRSYDFYIKADCGGGDTSSWVGPVVGTTSSYAAIPFPYTVNPLPYQLYSQPLANTFNNDDAYSAYIDLGFTFNFFGHDYSQVIVGTNSVLSFDSEDENNYCPWSISDVLPNANDIDNAILGAYQDYYNVEGGSQVYGFIGTAPFRKFVLFFDDVALYNCTTTTSANQIIIYETYNFIDVQIKDRNVCNTWNSGNAVVGIQNIGGQEAYFPANRNTGDWEAHNEGWRFTPVQNHPDYQYIICDDDTDGFATFDLNEVVTHFAPDTANGNVYSIYPTEEDAINNTNGIAIGNFVNTSNTQTIYFQEIDNTTGTVTLSSVLLAVIDCNADYDLDNIPSLNEDLNGNGNFGDDDTDGDNIPDFLDEDDDGDYVLTNVEAVDAGRANTTSYLDTDGDNIPNYLDNDDDGDGILSLDEDTNGNYNLLDDDSDGDNIPNYLDNEALSISENILNSFSIYPNPAKDVLIFTVKGIDDNLYYTIYNVQGSQVYNKQKVNTQKTTIDISNLSVGIYFVKLESNNQTALKKFVKK